MLKNFIYNLFNKSIIKTPAACRNFKYDYFLNEEYNKIIREEGYVLIKKAVSEVELSFLKDAYSKLQQFPDYSVHTKFQNSGRFHSPEIRKFVMDSIETFSKSFLPKIFNEKIFDKNTTGAFQIKPPSKESALNPHQDSPVIDELEHNALFIWIPLCNITTKNGAVSVLPKSHLWGNHQRSLNVPWTFQKHTKLLWKYMVPVYMNYGDILCWDTALIHASGINKSSEDRIAITTTILPVNYEMVDYYKDKNTAEGKIEKYKVERSFWERENIMIRPPIPPNKFIELENMVFPNNLSKRDLLNLITK